MTRLNMKNRIFPFALLRTARIASKCLKGELLMLFMIIGVSLLAGCDANALSDRKMVGASIQTNLYNYTSSEIMFARYDAAKNKFDIATAASAGSTPFTNNSVADIGSGMLVHFDEGHCCFDWRYSNDEDVSLNVLWLEVYDSVRYKQEDRRVDARSLREALPGSQWCEMAVKVRKPFPKDPGAMNLHFMPDGTVEANVAAAGVIEGYGPYPVEKVRRYSPRQKTPLCRNPVDNPWYLIPRKSHRE